MGCSGSSKEAGQPAAPTVERHAPVPSPQPPIVQCILQCGACGANMALEAQPERGLQVQCGNCQQTVQVTAGQVARRSPGSLRSAHGHPNHNLLGRQRPRRSLGALEEIVGEKALQEAIEQSKRQHLVNGLPREKYNCAQHRDIVECELCLEDYKAGDELMRLPCMHAFHSGCVSPWLQKAGSCPVCQIDACQALC